MALEKIDVLALGRGNLTDNSNAAIAFSANNLVATWSGAEVYAQYNVVEYSGRMYRSKIAGNTANQPDTSPNEWETLYITPKDGDLAVVVASGSSTVLQRVNGVWNPLTPSPITVALVDGQVAPADAVVFLGTSKAFAKLNYTLRRGSGQGRRRRGSFNALNDTVSAIDWDHEFNEIGTDVNAWLFWDMSGGNARLRYTSGLEGVTLELKYTLEGWT